jgi:hypothetical protein
MLRLKSGEEDKIAKELDIDSSILYITYIYTSILPTIDELLDWRNRLDILKSEEQYPGEWFDREIRATDYLLSKHTV